MYLIIKLIFVIIAKQEVVKKIAKIYNVFHTNKKWHDVTCSIRLIQLLAKLSENICNLDPEKRLFLFIAGLFRLQNSSVPW